MPGASNAAPSGCNRYDDVAWTCRAARACRRASGCPLRRRRSTRVYKYRISAGRLVKTILGLPTPDAIARTFALDAPGVREAPGPR